MRNLILGLALLIAGSVSAQLAVEVNSEYWRTTVTSNSRLDANGYDSTVFVDYNVTYEDSFFKAGPKVGVNTDFDYVNYLVGGTVGIQGPNVGFHIDGLYLFDDMFNAADVVVLRPRLDIPLYMDVSLSVGVSKDIQLKESLIKSNSAFLGLRYKF